MWASSVAYNHATCTFPITASAVLFLLIWKICLIINENKGKSEFCDQFFFIDTFCLNVSTGNSVSEYKRKVKNRRTKKKHKKQKPNKKNTLTWKMPWKNLSELLILREWLIAGIMKPSWSHLDSLARLQVLIFQVYFLSRWSIICLFPATVLYSFWLSYKKQVEGGKKDILIK